MRRRPASLPSPATPPSARRAVAQSLGAHAALIALLGWAVRSYPSTPRAAVATYAAPALEFSLLAAPPPRAVELEPLRAVPPSVPPRAPTARAPAFVPARVERPASAPRAAHAVLPPEPRPVVAEPPAPPAAPAAPRVNALDVLASRDHDANRVAAGGRAGLADVAPRGDDSRERVVAASRGYLRSIAAEGSLPMQIAGSWPYYHQLREEARQHWRRVPVPEPGVVDAALHMVVSDVRTAQRIAEQSLGPRAYGPSYAAGQALDHAHPNSPMLQSRNTMGAMAEATARTTRTEIEVDQSETGAVVALRVVRPSGVTAFDQSALSAVQEAIAQMPSRRMPGGWTSRWEFTVTVTRDLPLGMLPGAPGEAPLIGPQVGADFDEVTGEVIPRIPFMVHTRRRVSVVSSHRTAP